MMMNPYSTEQTEKMKQLPSAHESECSRISDNSKAVIEQTVKALDVKIEHLSKAQSDCSIYRVNKHLRDVNKKAYEPQIVAIGPYHRHGDVAHLQIMEDHKVRYLELLIKRKGKQDAAEYVAAVERVAPDARKCYGELPANLEDTEFVQMLVLDGCFIIELVRKFSIPQLIESNDPIFLMDWIRSSLKRDLLLFENQVPYLVLCELYDLIEAPNQRWRLAFLLHKFFKILCPENSDIRDVADKEIKHVLSLIHHCWIHQVQVKVKRKSEEGLQFIRSATRLSEANLSFVKNNGAQLDIDFEGRVMKMAPLNVEDRTESLFRNLIAYEQYCYRDELRYVSHYVKFLDCLIDSSKDVELLSHHEIIVNWLGDADVVAKMVNSLNDSVTAPGGSFMYGEILEKVNEHCKKPRNKWMAKLRQDYFNSPWSIISVVAALVLLLLTVAQTVVTLLQLFSP